MTPCVVILNTHSVILNEVKNLEVSEAVDCSTNLEILRCTQDDIEPTRDHAHIASEEMLRAAQHDISSYNLLVERENID